MGRPTISEAKIKQIRELYNKGLPLKAISVQAGVTHRTIQKYTQGIVRPVLKERYDEIASMRKKGMSTTQISIQLGISRAKVSKCCPAKKYMHTEPVQEEKPIIFIRPAAVYTNSRSPYGVYNPGTNQ